MPNPTRSAFTVEPTLVRDILAAVAFLFAEELPDRAYRTLMEPPERTFDALNRLIELRRENRS